MPSAYAHRRFGANVLEHLPAEVSGRIQPYRQLYDIGLHGPDILFYYHAVKSNPVSRLGGQMHDQPGAAFFDPARRVVREAKNRDAALAYALGFICHFALDSTCHPFIERYTRESGVTHCEIETEFDNQLLRRDGEDPQRFYTASHIVASKENAAVIADFYPDVTPAQIETTLRWMRALLWFFVPTNPAKRGLVLGVMRLIGKWDGMHGLVPNKQPNPACAASGTRLDALYGQALPLAERLILEYIDGLETDAPLDTAYQHTFGEF